MPAGVEGFVPGRLRMARQARALRQTELAALIGKSDATVSKYESEGQRPDPAVLPRLAEVLGVETSWFFRPLEARDETAVFNRSLVSELGVMRDKAKARLGYVEAIEETLSGYVDLPDLDVPDLLAGQDYRSLRREDIDLCAQALRNHWDLGDGPIEDLLLIIENAGIVVAEDEIGSVKLDGVSWWSPTTDRPYMLLAQDKNVAVRRRLDAAHELGHIILHRKVGPLELQRDFKMIEEQAMAFAGAFLLPAETFGEEVYSYSLDTLVGLKPRWKASVGAMIKRLSHIGAISDHYERRLWQYHSYRKWRAREPLDDEIPVEQPQNLRSSIELVVNEGVLTRHELLREVGLSAADVTSLTGLPPDYFAKPPGQQGRLKPALRLVGEDADRSGQVVPLRGCGRPA